MRARRSTFVVAAFGLVLLGIQFVQVERTNPPVAADLNAPPGVTTVLRRACYSCHSNETVWPWYSRVAPVSWLVAHDVREGRGELNFSAFGSLPRVEQQSLKQKAWEEIADGEMPLWYYAAVHGEARLTAEDKSSLRAWLDVPASESD